MNWGKSIMVAFTLFAVFIGVLVTVCVREQISLVSKDYYSDELNYQQSIDELNNAKGLRIKPAISILQKHVKVSFQNSVQYGELKLMRPSDARFDVSFSIGSDSVLDYDLTKYPPGKYNASLRWQMGGKMYLIQESVKL